ncbi:MAG: hypothetical protein ABI353_07510 [Isosphaeraceae bacterium]
MSTTARPLLSAERALAKAITAWGGAGDGSFWDIFAPSWRDRLLTSMDVEGNGPDAARRALGLEHEAEARPDLARVHPTWWVRALQEESPSVQRLVVSQVPTADRNLVRRGLGLTETDLTPDRSAHPDALRWVLSLWSERLVGGLPTSETDPAMVRVLTLLDPRTLLRLVSAFGLAKQAYAPSMFGTSDEPLPRPLRGRDRNRFKHFQRTWGDLEHRLARVARQDRSTGLAPPRLGLVTVGRVLAGTTEPFRARWTLQHQPYNVAKLIRGSMTLKHPFVPARALLHWETRAYRMACDRLIVEGKLPPGFGGSA